MPSLDLLLAAPSEPSQLTNWGDYHFGRALIAALRRQGVEARMLFRDTAVEGGGRGGGWSRGGGQRNLLVLRGKFRPNADWLRSSPYHLRLLWVISWPLDLTPEELSLYDLILVASAQDQPRIARLSGRPTITLPQATAFSSVLPPPADDGHLLFIGNTRGVERPIVQSFAHAACPLALIGQGWDQLGLRAEASSIANEQLPGRYRKALAVLNDHHGAMRDYGYLNNRLYDALACGVPVITDLAPGCPDNLRPAVILHQPGRDDPADAISAARRLRRQPELLLQIARYVRRDHSFTARTQALMLQLGHTPAPGSHLGTQGPIQTEPEGPA